MNRDEKEALDLSFANELSARLNSIFPETERQLRTGLGGSPSSGLIASTLEPGASCLSQRRPQQRSKAKSAIETVSSLLVVGP